MLKLFHTKGLPLIKRAVRMKYVYAILHCWITNMWHFLKLWYFCTRYHGNTHHKLFDKRVDSDRYRWKWCLRHINWIEFYEVSSLHSAVRNDRIKKGRYAAEMQWHPFHWILSTVFASFPPPPKKSFFKYDHWQHHSMKVLQMHHNWINDCKVICSKRILQVNFTVCDRWPTDGGHQADTIWIPWSRLDPPLVTRQKG